MTVLSDNQIRQVARESAGPLESMIYVDELGREIAPVFREGLVPYASIAAFAKWLDARVDSACRKSLNSPKQQKEYYAAAQAIFGLVEELHDLEKMTPTNHREGEV